MTVISVFFYQQRTIYDNDNNGILTKKMIKKPNTQLKIYSTQGMESILPTKGLKRIKNDATTNRNNMTRYLRFFWMEMMMCVSIRACAYATICKISSIVWNNIHLYSHLTLYLGFSSFLSVPSYTHIIGNTRFRKNKNTYL